MKIVVTGTDTDVGKTVFAAALAQALHASYWKPFQAGLSPSTDTETLKRLAASPPDRLLPEVHRFSTPVSVHRAAELEGITVDVEAIEVPDVDPLIIEGAGGALVPVTRQFLMADLFARWGLPTVVVARTTLGTINHSLATIEALRSRGVPILGIAFVGEAYEDSERTIAEIGGVRRLGRLRPVAPLDPAHLASAFAVGFRLQDFQ